MTVPYFVSVMTAVLAYMTGLVTRVQVMYSPGHEVQVNDREYIRDLS